MNDTTTLQAIDTVATRASPSKRPATVLNFVAPTCGFCKKQMPNVEKVRAEYEAKGVRFVNVYQKMGAKDFPPEEAMDVFKNAGSNLEMARDEGNTVGQSPFHLYRLWDPMVHACEK